jgi:hypothetical protein
MSHYKREEFSNLFFSTTVTRSANFQFMLHRIRAGWESARKGSSEAVSPATASIARRQRRSGTRLHRFLAITIQKARAVSVPSHLRQTRLPRPRVSCPYSPLKTKAAGVPPISHSASPSAQRLGATIRPEINRPANPFTLRPDRRSSRLIGMSILFDLEALP